MMVSVILLTYNHERYIAQALDSVLSQEAPFDFQVLVSEDCSTDRTRQIIARYAELHPERIRMFLSDRNLNTNEVTLRALRAASGAYVAFLDGDDYWTSPNKLERQVQFLEQHPECAMCFHNAIQFWEDRSQPSEHFNSDTQALTSGIAELLSGNFIAACSPMIRRSALSSIPAWFENCASSADWPLYFLAAQHGAIGFIPEIMGAYRIHGGGIWSAASPVRQFEHVIEFSNVLRQHLGTAHEREVVRLTAHRYRKLGLAHLQEANYGLATQALVRSLQTTTEFLCIARRERKLARIMFEELWGRPGKRLPLVRALARCVLSIRLPRSMIVRRPAARDGGWRT